MNLNINVYVIRYTNGSGIKSSAPCKDCYEKMIQFGVKKIIYSEDDGSFIKTKLIHYNPKTISLGRQFIEAGFKTIYRANAHKRQLFIIKQK